MFSQTCRLEKIFNTPKNYKSFIIVYSNLESLSSPPSSYLHPIQNRVTKHSILKIKVTIILLKVKNGWRKIHLHNSTSILDGGKHDQHFWILIENMICRNQWQSEWHPQTKPLRAWRGCNLLTEEGPHHRIHLFGSALPDGHYYCIFWTTKW